MKFSAQGEHLFEGGFCAQFFIGVGDAARGLEVFYRSIQLFGGFVNRFKVAGTDGFGCGGNGFFDDAPSLAGRGEAARGATMTLATRGRCVVIVTRIGKGRLWREKDKGARASKGRGKSGS